MPSNGMTDDRDETVELLQRWHAGDRGALSQLLAQHLPDLHRHVHSKLDRELRSLRREADSMDLVQAAALRVMDYLPPFAPRDGAQFQALLRRIVLNETRNELRSPNVLQREPSRDQYADSVLDLKPSPSSSIQPDRAAEKVENRAEARAWARLALEFLASESDRRLVLLAAVEEQGWNQIGLELGLSPDAARMRFQRLLPRMANHVRKLREGRVEELSLDDSD